PVKITDQVRGDQVVTEGGDLHLFCKVTGRPAPSITWTKVPTGVSTEIKHYGPTWDFTNVSVADSGTYSCVADNKVEDPVRGQAVKVIVFAHVSISATHDEYIVVVGESVTLNCKAKGNPLPSYTWTPCGQDQVCNKNTFVIPQVSKDANYTCEAANEYSNDSKSYRVFIGGSLINVTLFSESESCANGGYDLASLLKRLSEMMNKVFAGTPSYESVYLIDFRCGSVIVDLALKFTIPTKEQAVITILRNAAVVGRLEDFSVRGFNENAVGPTTPSSSLDESSELQNETKAVTIWIIVGAVFGSVAALAAAGILVWWACRKRRLNRKGTEGAAIRGSTNRKSSNERRGNTNIAIELPKPSQSHYMALDDRSRSQAIANTIQNNSPHRAEQISEYTSLNAYTCPWEISREHVMIKQIVGKGAFGQVAKATAVGLQGRPKKALVADKMLK
ncbi:kin of IRRE-like protein 2, partial [Stylophora pistillata]